MDWQPIETAQKEDGEILTWNEDAGYFDIACWDQSSDRWETQEGMRTYFTHWMPLPAPPATDEATT